MLIEFTVSNYKSIKNEQTFSLAASNLKEFKENYSSNPNKNDIKLDILKFAAIYGANGSGKSNLLKAIRVMQEFILNSTDAKLNEEINYYFPYKLDGKSKSDPVNMEIEFINKDKIRYRYSISYNRFEILNESLFYYPKGQESKLFDRKPGNEIEYGDSLRGEKKIIEKQLLKNVLFLSKGANSNNKQLEKIYEYFQLYSLCVIQGSFHHDFPLDMNYNLISPQQLEIYLSAFDTGIKKVQYRLEDSPEADHFIKFIMENTKSSVGNPDADLSIYNDLKYKPDFIHDVYVGDKKTGTESFKLNEESIGTQKLYKILGSIYRVLKEGGTLILDEINNSFHTHLTKFLIEIFQSKNTNKKNSQLIFSTHDTTVLDYRLFRRDQIWFTEKDKYGATTLYSLIEFKNSNLRQDTPIEKWYLSGRFGALPIFNDLNLLEQDAEATENSK
ncbi:MAG: ATP-binding protein [Ignavibacteriae bacterium]|nr:ATP-binding protein [Ignavibacteriota bacterium]